jgi:hypothetical protein
LIVLDKTRFGLGRQPIMFKTVNDKTGPERQANGIAIFQPLEKLGDRSEVKRRLERRLRCSSRGTSSTASDGRVVARGNSKSELRMTAVSGDVWRRGL